MSDFDDYLKECQKGREETPLVWLRDEMAKAAMEHFLALDIGTSCTFGDIASSSYDMAEAMLKERAKRLEKDNA